MNLPFYIYLCNAVHTGSIPVEDKSKPQQTLPNGSAPSSTYGVKRSSILNQSCYFHVVDGLDLDVMHDQLEGVLPLEIKLSYC